MRHQSLLLLFAVAASCSSTAAAATADVCALPAAALFVPATNASAPLARCWSESAGVTVSAPCVTACACRRLEVSAGQQRGACLNSSASFRCANSGGTDCSAYALNADGSSTLRSRGSTESQPPSAGSADAAPRPTTAPPVSVIVQNESEDEGLAAWAWALIVLAPVLGVSLAVFAICWCRRRRGGEKRSADSLERTESVDAWKDADALEAAARLHARAVTTAPPPPPPPVVMTTTTTPAPANSPEPVLNLVAAAGVSGGVGYHTYRIGSIAESERESRQRQQHMRTSDDDASSIELHSPVYHQHRDSYSSRRSSIGGRERLTNGSRLSYASVSSYGSEADSFTSQLTFGESEPRDTEPASDAYYHEHEQQQRFFGADIPPYPRKKSTEF